MTYRQLISATLAFLSFSTLYAEIPVGKSAEEFAKDYLGTSCVDYHLNNSNVTCSYGDATSHNPWQHQGTRDALSFYATYGQHEPYDGAYYRPQFNWYYETIVYSYTQRITHRSHTYNDGTATVFDPLCQYWGKNIPITPSPEVPSIRVGSGEMGYAFGYGLTISFTPTIDNYNYIVHFLTVMNTSVDGNAGETERAHFKIRLLDGNGREIPQSKIYAEERENGTYNKHKSDNRYYPYDGCAFYIMENYLTTFKRNAWNYYLNINNNTNNNFWTYLNHNKSCDDDFDNYYYYAAYGYGSPLTDRRMGFLEDGTMVTWDEMYHGWDNYVIDLSDYIGQTITLEMEQVDCTSVNCYSYGYVAITCEHLQTTCSSESTSKIVAPGNLTYEWHKGSKTGPKLGTNQILEAPADGTTYYCKMTGGAIATSVWDSIVLNPLAQPTSDFEYTIKHGTCRDTVYITNTSYLTLDGERLDRPVDGCFWNFGDGKTKSSSTDYNPSSYVVFSNPGKHTIRLITYSISPDCATDTITKDIYITAGEEYQVHYDTICEGDYFQFGKDKLTMTGTYFATITKKEDPTLNCMDTVQIEQHLLVLKPFYSEITDSICKGEKYMWRGVEIEPGDYADSLLTRHNCDSIYILHLKERAVESYDITIRDTICEGETYHWNGNDYTKSGIYTMNFTSWQGCDSIVHLDLFVTQKKVNPEDVPDQPNYDPEENKLKYEICMGGFVRWHGQEYTDEGDYHDTLLNIYGCDSIVTMHLTVHPNYYFSESHVMKEGETYHWEVDGKDYTESGTFYDSLTSMFYCDSIHELNIYLENDTEFYVFDTICDGRTYYVSDLTTTYSHTKAGIYDDMLEKYWGGDSLVHLHLYVRPITKGSFDTTLCEGDKLEWYGYNWDELTPQDASDDYYVEIASKVTGCDSIASMKLHINPKTYGDTSVSICSQSYPYTWRGKDYDAPGDYISHSTNMYGCDSVITLHLRTVQVDTTHRYEDVCHGEGVYFYGKRYTESGEYEMRLTSKVTGCDSLDILHLHTRESQLFFTDSGVCLGSLPVQWRGHTLNKTTTVSDVYVNQYGCDSIYTLFLTVGDQYATTKNISICEGQLPYKWRGKEYTESGTYNQSAKSKNDCDSLFVLNLTVKDGYDEDVYDTICYGASYKWGSTTITKSTYNSVTGSNTYSGEYTKKYSGRTKSGCDSIVTLHLWINQTFNLTETGEMCDGEVFVWHGKPHYVSGTWTDSLQSKAGCDSITTLKLVVHDRYDPKYRKKEPNKSKQNAPQEENKQKPIVNIRKLRKE